MLTLTLTAAKFNDGFMDFLYSLIHCYCVLCNPFTALWRFRHHFHPLWTSNVMREKVYLHFQFEFIFQFVIRSINPSTESEREIGREREKEVHAKPLGNRRLMLFDSVRVGSVCFVSVVFSLFLSISLCLHFAHTAYVLSSKHK